MAAIAVVVEVTSYLNSFFTMLPLAAAPLLDVVAEFVAIVLILQSTQNQTCHQINQIETHESYLNPRAPEHDLVLDQLPDAVNNIIKEYAPVTYVQQHNWTDEEDIPEAVCAIMRRPLRWRPTLLDPNLFKEEIDAIRKRIANKIRIESKELVKHSTDIMATARINTETKRSLTYLNDGISTYIANMIENPIRNRNMTLTAINAARALRKQYPNVIVAPADKNRGNVYLSREWWSKFNQSHLETNDANFELIENSTREQLIMAATEDTREYLRKYKRLIVDANRANSELEKHQRIGTWSPIPKVHKKNKDGTQKRALRPIVNHKNSVITVSCLAAREIARKLNAGLALVGGPEIDMDDIRRLIRRLIGSMIQGSISGGDLCSLRLRVLEIQNQTIIQTQFKLYIRYKDDILAVSNHRTAASFERVVRCIYDGMEFETEDPSTNATICDIDVEIDSNGKLRTCLQRESGKVRSYVLKSSNVRQSCSSILGTLCRRYICIADTPRKYLTAKRIVCATLVCGEWTPADIRRSRHPSFDQRAEMIQTYRANRLYKLKRYANMVKLHLFNKKWVRGKDENATPPTNFYATYQKTFIDDRQIRAIIDESLQIAPEQIRQAFDYNIYYRYQPSIGDIASLR